MMATEVKVESEAFPTKTVVPSSSNDSLHPPQEDCREENMNRRDDGVDERDGDAGQSRKKSSPARGKNNNGNNSKRFSGMPPQQQGRFPYPPNMTGRMPFPMNRGGGPPPYGAPPPYGYPGSSYGHPPPHFHHHPHMPMPYPGGPYSGPPHGGHGGMKGGYHHHPPPPPHYGQPYGMPPSYPQHPGAAQHPGANLPPSYPPPHMMQSDSASISSKNSKNSKKKRTIEGVHGNNLPSAYSFRRTDSNSSANSTVTAGNNTSMETNLTEESTTHEHSEDVPDLHMDGLIFEDRSRQQQQSSKPRPYHRRDYSTASTASTLSVGGFSLSSYEGPRVGITEDAQMSDGPLLKASPKRHKKNGSLMVDTGSRPSSSASNGEHENSSRFEQLSIDTKVPTSTSSSSTAGNERSIFLSLSTSPINTGTQSHDVDATPISKNTKKEAMKNDQRNAIFKPKGDVQLSLDPDRPSDTPTPPVHGELGVREAMNDDHSMLNSHLRGQSFTPLPHIAHTDTMASSPSNTAFASALGPQLSWSIAGDTPSLDDLAEWEEEDADHAKLKTENKSRPGSTSSADTRNMTISPHDFQLWKDEHDLNDPTMSGTTTPLPAFFDQSGGEAREGSENQVKVDHQQKRNQHHPSEPDSNGSMYKGPHKTEHPHWQRHEQMQLPPTPMYPSSEYRDDGYGVRSPHHGGRRDMEYYPSYHHPGHGPHDRIRNLRGRLPPGAHMPPIPLHIPPPMSSHLPMTSPMGLAPKGGMWSPHHGMQPHLASPHHMGSPLNNMAQSKRKCVPLKPPIPSKFQGDMDKSKGAPVPEFTSLVNFPSHMSQKQSVNLPEGMRCCVMCGQACPCSAGGKGKKSSKPASNGSGEGGLAPRTTNGQDHMGDKNSGYAIIPTQNKGLCTLCDVNVWVVVTSGLEIKWCKGCKNFRPWAAFGDKGLATKCLRCRERQREKYALQKEEKEKARNVTKTSSK